LFGVFQGVGDDEPDGCGVVEEEAGQHGAPRGWAHAGVFGAGEGRGGGGSGHEEGREKVRRRMSNGQCGWAGRGLSAGRVGGGRSGRLAG
jgi:hypothetical protein